MKNVMQWMKDVVSSYARLLLILLTKFEADIYKDVTKRN